MFMQKNHPKKTKFSYFHAKKQKTQDFLDVRSPFVPWLDRSGSGGGVYYGGDEELLRLGQLKLDLGSSALAPGRPRPIDDGLLIREIKPLANGPTFFLG